MEGVSDSCRRAKGESINRPLSGAHTEVQYVLIYGHSRRVVLLYAIRSFYCRQGPVPLRSTHPELTAPSELTPPPLRLTLSLFHHHPPNPILWAYCFCYLARGCSVLEVELPPPHSPGLEEVALGWSAPHLVLSLFLALGPRLQPQHMRPPHWRWLTAPHWACTCMQGENKCQRREWRRMCITLCVCVCVSPTSVTNEEYRKVHAGMRV